MNNITDITILIAVIALALWPIVLFLLKTISIRKKRLEHLERMTKNKLDNISTQDLVISVLKKNRLPARNKRRRTCYFQVPR